MRAYIYSEENFIPKDDGFDYSVHFKDIDNHISPSECTEIILDDTLDFIKNRDMLLNKIVSCIRYGGKLRLHGFDMEELAKDIYLKQISVGDALTIVNSRQLSSLSIVIRILQQLNLTILKKSYIGNQYYITAGRDGIN